MAKDLKGKGSPEQTLVRELAALLDETGLGEIEIEREGVRVRVARRMAIEAAIGMPAQSAIQQSAAQLAEGAPKKTADDPAKHPGAVKSPMVGTAYLAPEPGAAPFIEVGIARRPGPDDPDHRGHEDHEPHPGPQGRHGHRHSRRATASRSSSASRWRSSSSGPDTRPTAGAGST